MSLSCLTASRDLLVCIIVLKILYKHSFPNLGTEYGVLKHDLFGVCVQGTSTKYSPQRVGLHHQMHDEDVIQVTKK